ncbi:hypothetical protein BC829DRAFT_386195 [Chytridium lagenaria]|nr:hypothetical protein BC829DRAFT_386195 [Chytridium lagenaria]
MFAIDCSECMRVLAPYCPGKTLVDGDFIQSSQTPDMYIPHSHPSQVHGAKPQTQSNLYMNLEAPPLGQKENIVSQGTSVLTDSLIGSGKASLNQGGAPTVNQGRTQSFSMATSLPQQIQQEIANRPIDDIAQQGRSATFCFGLNEKAVNQGRTQSFAIPSTPSPQLSKQVANGTTLKRAYSEIQVEEAAPSAKIPRFDIIQPGSMIDIESMEEPDIVLLFRHIMRQPRFQTVLKIAEQLMSEKEELFSINLAEIN